MIKIFLLALIFAAAVCGAVFAADNPTMAREEILLGSAKTGRLSPVLAAAGGVAARATIDMADAALPKSVSAPAAETQAAPEALEEEPVLSEETVSAPQVQLQSRGMESEQQVVSARPARQIKFLPDIKFKMPWQGEPKKEPTEEEKVQHKIEGRRFGGETGFTTVTTYRTKGIKASGEGDGLFRGTGAPVMLGIDDCIKIAEANHIQAIVAKKSIKLAEMRLFEARRNMLPSATVVVERSKGRVSDYNYLGRKQYIEGQQPIFHGGELYFTMKQAEVNLQIAKNDHNRVKNELVLQVRKAYYTLEKAKENAALQQILSGEVERMYGISSKGYAGGAIAKVEYLNVSSQASQVKYQLASADGEVSVAALILRQAMNVNPRENFDITPSPEFKRVTLDFENTMQDAFMNRPEIKANALMVTYYNYGKGIANAKSLPKVDLLGQWGLAWEDYVSDSNDGGELPGGGTITRRTLQPQWYAGIKVGVPFAGNTAEYSYTREQWTPVVQTVKGTEATTNSFKFKILDKLDMFSDKQLADIDYDRSRSELNKTKNDIMLEVKEGCFNYEKALIQLETAGSKVKYQSADSEVMRLKRGMDEVQDSNVIDGLIKLAQEKFSYVQAVTDCKIALAALEKAVGVQDYFKDK